jgi:hypothetical protein
MAMTAAPLCPRVVGASGDGKRLLLCGQPLPCPRHLSAHEWERTTWHGQPAMICARCGYLWKPGLARPTKDCEPA